MAINRIKFEKNHQNHDVNEVLIDVPYGKYYLSDLNTPKNQNAQKGETCWYYVMNYLRPRYGNFFGEAHPERNIEKIISTARKQLEQTDRFKKNCINIQNYFSKVNLSLETMDHAITVLTACGADSFAEEIRIGKEFLSQNQFAAFDVYYEDKLRNSRIDIYKKALMNLGLNIDKLFSKYLEKFYSGQSSDVTLALTEKIYADIFQHVAADKYNLQKTTWNPNESIVDLIETLRESGCLYVGGQFGSTYCQDLIIDGNREFGKRPVCEVIEVQDGLAKSIATHAILIIGAKKSAEGEFVYYLDPNDANSVESKGKLYKISYARVIAGITDTHSMRIKVRNLFANNRVYGLHADLDKIDAEYSKHNLKK